MADEPREHTANLLDVIPTPSGAARGRKLTELSLLPPPPFLFEGFMRSRSITALVAAPHSYKTFIMLAMALALDWDLPLFGRFKPVRSMKCFFVGADAPDWDYGQMVQKLQAGYGIPVEKRDLTSIEGVFDERINILHPRFDEWLLAYDKEHGFDAIFIDDKRSTTHTNENDSQQAALVHKVLKRWRSRGKTVIYSHHTAIPNAASPDRPAIYAGRGSSADPGACDYQFNLTNVSRLAVGNTQVRFDAAKGRGLASPPDLELIEAIYEDTQEVNAAKEPVQSVRFVAPSKVGRRDLILNAVIAGTSDRDALVTILRQAESSYTKEAGYRAVDNELQSLRKAGKIANAGRGLWVPTKE